MTKIEVRICEALMFKERWTKDWWPWKLGICLCSLGMILCLEIICLI